MKRLARSLAALVALAVLLGACSQAGDPAATRTPPDGTGPTPVAAAATPAEPGPDAAAPSDPVTITFGAQSYLRPAYEPLIEQFNQQNPGVHVQFVSIDAAYQVGGGTFDLGAQVRQIVSMADVVSLYVLRKEDIAAGYVADLQPLIDADATFDRADFYPNMLEQYQLDAGLYMIPRSRRMPLLSYNKRLWQRSGLPTPRPDWTYADMLAAAERLVEKRGDTIAVYGMADWSSGWNELVGALAGAGIDLYSLPSEQLRFDQPEFATALSRAAQLIRSGAVYYKHRGPDAIISPDEFQQLIRGEQLAMWNRDLATGPPDQQLPFEVGTLPYPVRPGQPAFFGEGEGYAISGGSQHPAAAWRWLAFLSAQSLSVPFAIDTASELPARKSVAERSGYWQKLDAETKAAAEAILARPVVRRPAQRPAQPGSLALYAPLSDALEQVLSTGAQPEQALRAAQARLEELRAQIRLTPQPTAAASQPIVVATPQAETQVAADATRITFGALPGPNGTDPLLKLAARFNQDHPELFVEVKSIDFTGQMPTLASIAAQYDCFSWWSAPRGAEISATLDLQPLLDADTQLARNDYPELLLEPYQSGSKLSGLPLAVSFLVLSYNKTAFDAAGLAYPSAGWSLDDLANAAQALTKGKAPNQQYGYVSRSGEINDLIFFINRYGGRPITGRGDTTRPNFTDAKVVAAVRAYLDLLKNSSPSTALSGYRREGGGSEGENLIRQGRAGMWFDYGLFLAQMTFGGTPGFEVALAPVPLNGGQLAREDFYSRGMFIAAQTQHPEACWAWLKALSGDPAAFDDDFPARSSVAESDAFLSTAPQGAAAVYQAYREALGRTGSSGPESDSAFDSAVDLFWFFRAADNALHGKPLDRELADAQALTEQFMACTRGGGAGPACAKQVDPKYEGWQSGAGP